MGIFAKNKLAGPAKEREAASDKMASKITSAGIRMQVWFSERINSLLLRVTTRSLKTVLIIFCVSSGGFSMYLVARAMVGPMDKQASFRMEHQMEQFSIPKHIDQPGEERISPDVQAEEEIASQLQRIKRCMDSLKLHNKKIYDSIWQARPGLMDSVQMLEEIYHLSPLK